MTTDSYFLSDENPVATTDQRDLETKALSLLQSPDLQRARQIITLLWQNAIKYPAQDQWSRFENAIDEYLFHQALYGANGDPLYPQILRIMEPGCHWFGRDIPGSRWGGDSPDFIYRIIPVEHGGKYRVTGKTTCNNPPTVTYSLVASGGAAPATVSILDSLDMQIDSNGEFVITIDESPPGSRKNHLQTKPGIDHLMIRDALGDWLNETPNALRVEQTVTPSRPPLTDEVRARNAAHRALNGFYYTFYCTQSGSGQPPNELRPPLSSAPFGGMATQWGTKGNLCLEEDEALVITSNHAGARFRNIVLCDAFFMSINYWQTTSSLNMSQMAADVDGKFTFVVSHADPGIHNWVDTNGLRRTIFGHRWQAFPGGNVEETPLMTSRLVNFSDLQSVLPKGVRQIDAAGRRAQIESRLAGFNKRNIDH